MSETKVAAGQYTLAYDVVSPGRGDASPCSQGCGGVTLRDLHKQDMFLLRTCNCSSEHGHRHRSTFFCDSCRKVADMMDKCEVRCPWQIFICGTFFNAVETCSDKEKTVFSNSLKTVKSVNLVQNTHCENIPHNH